MKIKKGDKVQVILGKDKGKVAEVLYALPKTNQVVVEGVNIKKKAIKPSGENEEGGFTSAEAPISVSNVMFYDSKAKKPTKIGFKVENGKKSRIMKKSGNAVKEAKK